MEYRGKKGVGPVENVDPDQLLQRGRALYREKCRSRIRKDFEMVCLADEKGGELG